MQCLRAGAFCLAFCLLAGCSSSPARRDVAVEYYNIGNAYVDLGQNEKAVQAFRDALRLDPGLVKADYNLALTYARMKKAAEAQEILVRLLRDDPENAGLMSALAWSYHLAGKEAEALVQYDAVLALAPADQETWYNSGMVLWKLDRKAEALERFRKLLALSPDDTDALFASASLLISMDDPSAAGEMLSRYLEKKPGDIEAWYMAAAAADRLQKYSREMEAFEKILSLNSKQADAWFGEARILLTAIEDPQKGLEALAKALSAGFSDAEAVKTLLAAPTLLERGKVEAALKEKDLLPEPKPESPQGPQN